MCALRPNVAGGLAEELCESDEEAQARINAIPRQPADQLLVLQAWGCAKQAQGIPHTHRDDVPRRYPQHD